MKSLGWVGRLAAVMVATTFLFTCGCGSGQQADEGATSLKLAYVMAPQGAYHEAAQRFSSDVNERTNGKVRIDIKHSAQLGTDRKLTEGLVLGSVDMALSGFASVSGYIPEYEPLEAPFVYRDYEHMRDVLAGEIGKEAEETLWKRKGIRILSWWPRGPRNLTANKPVRTQEDLAGLKIRVPELPHYIATWEMLGANPTPITYSEMFMALKQGVVEAQEHPLEVIFTAGLYDVQTHVMRTDHLLSAYMLMIGKPALGKLTEEQKKIIRQEAGEAAEFEEKRML